jgi:biopolymer transport protein ExbD
MSQSGAHVGVGLYFIDVLACLLFSLALVLTAARFGRESSVEVLLPESNGGSAPGAELPALAITVRSEAGQSRVYLEDEAVEWETLVARLRALEPVAVVVRSEATPLARAIAAAHDAGITEIGMAVADSPGSPEAPRKEGP